MCYICEISHLHLRNFSIVFIIHIKCFIYFSLPVPVVLKGTHPKNEQNRVLYFRRSAFKSYGHFEECFYLKNFFKVSSNSCMDFTFLIP